MTENGILKEDCLELTSDGFIDRAYSDLNSYYLSGSYLGEKTSIQAVVFSGHEKTYQAWEGTPLQVLDTNKTFNPYTYENKIDNYNKLIINYTLQINRLKD